MIQEIKEDYCSFETSVLLKEKGFQVNCASYYMGSKKFYADPIMNHNNPNFTKEKYSRPTHSIASKWLQANFKMHPQYIVIATTNGLKYFGNIAFQEDSGLFRMVSIDDDQFKSFKKLGIGNSKIFDSPEDAMEAAILKSLSLIP